jgi:hypothetical protein
MSNNKKIVVFFDGVSRTVVGQEIESNDKTLTVKDPAVLHLQPNPQTGQLSLQILPLFFKEFLADKADDVVVSFTKDSIAIVKDPVLDFKILAQYEQIMSLASQPQPEQPLPGQQPTSDDVVKLFDDEDDK